MAAGMCQVPVHIVSIVRGQGISAGDQIYFLFIISVLDCSQCGRDAHSRASVLSSLFWKHPHPHTHSCAFMVDSKSSQVKTVMHAITSVSYVPPFICLIHKI